MTLTGLTKDVDAAAVAASAVSLQKPPCQGSNLGHRSMACPRMDKAEKRCLALTKPPAHPLTAGL
jgi:hypothetical protein